MIDFAYLMLKFFRKKFKYFPQILDGFYLFCFFFLYRHKEMAPHRYMQLDEKLRKDTRLSDIYF